MKALTVCQPYAHLIVRGDKLVENREWPTRYRGPLLIHAGKSRDWLVDGDLAHFREVGDPMVFGAIVGLADLIDVLPYERIRRGEFDSAYPWLRDHEHTRGTWCWVLSNVRRAQEPLPWRGAQGLWEMPWDDGQGRWVPASAQRTGIRAGGAQA